MKSHQAKLSRRALHHPHRSPHFKHAALALAVSSALAPMAVPASEWNRNVEVYLMPSTQGRLLYGGALLQPIWQDNQSLFYGDLRGTVTQMEGKDTEFNFGLGYRWLTPQRDWILGGYAAFDTRDTLNDNRFNQITFGVEALSDMYDARFNYYVPITDEKLLGPGLGGGLFQAHTLFANGIYEEALQGFDGEVGVRVPWIEFAETRVYLGGYHFDGSVTPKAADGVKGRIEMRLMQDITLGVSAQSDDLFGGETMLQLRYSFGYPNVNRKRTVPERMIQFVERDIDIKATDRLGSVDGLHGSFHGVESGDGDMGHKVTVSTSVYHIDNTAAAGGDGSFEHPYNTITNCLAGGCAMPSTFVYVHAGDGTTTGYNTTFTMANNQTLWGQGFNLFGLGGDKFPILTSGSNGVVLANNTEVAGLQINGAGNNAFYGSNISGNINIHNNRILNTSNVGVNVHFMPNASFTATIANNLFQNTGNSGTYLFTPASGTGNATQSINITGNTFADGGNEGIEVFTGVRDTANLTQNLNITNNTITNNTGGTGIYLHIYNRNSGHLTQVANISNNTITGSADQGVYIKTRAYDSSTITQTLKIASNNISNNGENGIRIINRASYNSVISQTSTITGNTISGNGERGIDVYNKAYNDGGHITQTLTIANNTITNNSESGIYLHNRAYYNGSITQTVSIANNTISGNGDRGIFVSNDASTQQCYYYGCGGSSGGSISQTLNIASNTISNNNKSGIYLHNFAGYESSVTQTATISNNTISGNLGNGIFLQNKAAYYGSSSQTVTMTGNTIKNNAGHGIRIYNYAYRGGIATQHVDLSGGGNTISGNGGFGVHIYNRYSDGTANQTVVLRNSTIVNNTSGAVYYNGRHSQTITLPDGTVITN